MFYRNLQEITSQESGAVQYADGSIWIGNWSSIQGIPRLFMTEMIGLAEELHAKRTAAPKDVIRAMRQHAKELGDSKPATTGYRAWRVNVAGATDTKEDTIVVTNSDWA